MEAATSEMIRVGHVEVPDYWIDLHADTSMTVNDVISRSGMRPRDGSDVNCYLARDGVLVTGAVDPGQTVLVGASAPEVKVPIDRRISRRWRMPRSRSSCSGSTRSVAWISILEPSFRVPMSRKMVLR